ncbi:hypothetical protein SCHPADRAFT_897482, partial [Schizopora paradoxa]
IQSWGALNSLTRRYEAVFGSLEANVHVTSTSSEYPLRLYEIKFRGRKRIDDSISIERCPCKSLQFESRRRSCFSNPKITGSMPMTRIAFSCSQPRTNLLKEFALKICFIRGEIMQEFLTEKFDEHVATCSRYFETHTITSPDNMSSNLPFGSSRPGGPDTRPTHNDTTDDEDADVVFPLSNSFLDELRNDDATTVYTYFSTVSTNYTMSNLPGPGRLLGNFYSRAGRTLERRLGRI